MFIADIFPGEIIVNVPAYEGIIARAFCGDRLQRINPSDDVAYLEAFGCLPVNVDEGRALRVVERHFHLGEFPSFPGSDVLIAPHPVICIGKRGSVTKACGMREDRLMQSVLGVDRIIQNEFSVYLYPCKGRHLQRPQ